RRDARDERDHRHPDLQPVRSQRRKQLDRREIRKGQENDRKDHSHRAAPTLSFTSRRSRLAASPLRRITIMLLRKLRRTFISNRRVIASSKSTSGPSSAISPAELIMRRSTSSRPDSFTICRTAAGVLILYSVG